MAAADLWAFAARQLETGVPCTLILVGAHQGSSPGRRGFKMAVTAQDMCGSIGGGIMEHKFVELVRARMAAGEAVTELRRQVHSKAAPQDQSGMICSGEQTLLLHSLPLTALPIVQRLLRSDALPCILGLDPQGLSVLEGEEGGQGLVESGPGKWRYSERIGGKATAYVVGGGHVGLAMCKLLADLDFRVVNLDDRADLHTMQQNAWADERVVMPYTDIAARIPEGPDTYIVVMSFGYRTDAVVMRQLLGRRYAYLGMMGSRAKVAQLWAELRAEGYAEADIAQVSAPAGIAIGSQTPAEIAVSIAAELIQRRQSPTF